MSPGSPSLWWDDEVCLRWESDYAASHRELGARAFLYLGALEADVIAPPARELWSRLRRRHYVGLDLLRFVIVADENQEDSSEDHPHGDGEIVEAAAVHDENAFAVQCSNANCYS